MAVVLLGSRSNASLLFLRRGVAAVLKESKQRKGEKGINITVLLINKSLLIACFWSHL